MRTSLFSFIMLLLLAGCSSKPEIRLPSLIGDNMLLKQNSDARIWGKAKPGSRIKITASWEKMAKAKTGEDGRWSTVIPTPAAGGPYTLTIASGDTTIQINNILIGEVWFCSGQSNMEMPVTGWPPKDTIQHSAATIAGAALPEIRLFNVQKTISGSPLDECTGKWEICSPETVKQFSATAFFFGRKLNSSLKIPVALIESAWGGTPSEAWTSAASLEKAGEFSDQIKAMKESEPLQAEYQKWLDSHPQVTLNQGDNQYKNLELGDKDVPSVTFNDSAWPVMTLPSLFEKATGEFDGAVWFRKKVELPKEMTGQDLILSLGPIDDMDRTFFNGELVGSTEESGLYQKERIYTVPASLVKPGENYIAVRVLDTQGGGGIYGKPADMKLTAAKKKQLSVAIDGEWKYQPVAEFKGSKFYVYDISKSEYQTMKRPVSLGPSTPSTLYNGMVSPVIPYTISGAIWYQGEANVGRSAQYSKIFPAMINNWREAWNIKDLPFYFVQIAPYIYAGLDSTESGDLREAQESALKLPATGMVVTLDIATVLNIHPPYKTEVGDRLAALALNDMYGIKTKCYGPVYKSSRDTAGMIALRFDNADGGLVSKDKELTEFEIAGKDGRFVKAYAEIKGSEVIVSSAKVKEPAAVRYCWRNGAQASLFNKDGLAALQFRTH